jgi:hypothetical protein
MLMATLGRLFWGSENGHVGQTVLAEMDDSVW